MKIKKIVKSQKASDVFKVGKNQIGDVWSSFTSEFGKDKVLPGKVLKSQKLPRYMNDGEIISEFKIQECTLGDVLATLKAADDDMKDGNWNIFYIKGHPSHVVFVYWSETYRGWNVLDWDRGYFWFAGERVFSPATNSQTISSSPESSDSLPLILIINNVKYKRVE